MLKPPDSGRSSDHFQERIFLCLLGLGSQTGVWISEDQLMLAPSEPESISERIIGLPGNFVTGMTTLSRLDFFWAVQGRKKDHITPHL